MREIVTLAFDWSREGLRTGEERRSEHDEPYLKTARSELEPVEASSSSRAVPMTVIL